MRRSLMAMMGQVIARSFRDRGKAPRRSKEKKRRMQREMFDMRRICARRAERSALAQALRQCAEGGRQ